MSQDNEQSVRVDLAAALRIAARLGMHEAVANHFSAAISEDGTRFLINPKWRHFSRIRARDLVLVDARQPGDADSRDLDPTAWAIHGQLHRINPRARVAMHLHPVHATAIATLQDPVIPPIDQNTARYFRRIAIDRQYGGMADSAAEGARLAALMGDRTRLMMGNHGVMVVARTVGEAFDDMYTLERACQILVTAYSTGRPLSVLADDVAEKTAGDWERITDFSIRHFEEMKLILDREEPDYKD
ncbi:class II aldolase/adducin family protein [Nguyenibacter vanlangensis]|uniref:Class II aldolase/adducin family protein n=1 Tax=Nguyenibacter vanlangensis TaxID=1216886 RepID=A0A7Y7M739_9PROT|nr:class II aldolase/adducin family protein [Nguyenibacter vanlangensis]NVN11426.1 class II aldolase/adducin family protein [Nguyenibacter vanlangensis]